jgi:hypothetical protein
MKSVVTKIKFGGVDYDVERTIKREDGTEYYVLIGYERKVKGSDCEILATRLVI